MSVLAFTAGNSLILAGLLAAAAALLATAQLMRVPYPIALVLGGLPRRLISVIEGESLVNDGTALVAYRFAVAAVVTGSFSLLEASSRFVLNVAGGIAVGLAVGVVLRQVRRRLDNPPLELTISILSGYFAYLPAQAAGVSGVLAAVTVGIYMGWYTPELTTPQTRLQGIAMWEILFFLLNGLLFALIGLQLRGILDALSGRPAWTLVRDAL